MKKKNFISSCVNQFIYSLVFGLLIWLPSICSAELEDTNEVSQDIKTIESYLEKNVLFSLPRNDEGRSTIKTPKAVNFKDIEIVGDYQDIAVIQRNYMPKTSRFALSLGGTLTPTDVYFRTGGLNAKLGYHINEYWGLEANTYYLGSAARSEINDLEKKQSLLVQSLVPIRSFYGLNLFYSSIYGKTSILNRKIIPFEIYQTLGLGRVTNQYGGESTSFQIGLGELLSISRSSAVRADLTWAFYNTDSISGTQQNANSIFLSVNYMLFFGELAYR